MKTMRMTKTAEMMTEMANRRGTLFVLSGPSGAGKGTLREKTFESVKGIAYSISCTTREPREGERDGVEYFFVTEEEFDRRIAAGDFLEWANVHGHKYGTLRPHVEEVLSSGSDMLLEIDVQGALQVKEKMPEAVTVFIAPPSPEVLERRLRGRGTETEEQISVRLANARKEMDLQKYYDLVIVNGDLDRAVAELSGFIEHYRQ